MKISKLKIDQYKSVKEPMNLDLHPANIFIGQNNSGKSNIFDAVEFVAKPLGKDDKCYYPNSKISMEIEFNEDDQKNLQLPGRNGILSIEGEQRSLSVAGKNIDYNDTLRKFFTTRIKRLDHDGFHNYKQIEEDYHTLFNYPTSLDRFKKFLNSLFPKVSASKNAMDIEYEHEGLYEGQRRVTIDRMGSGFRQVFVILLYIFHPEYTVVMIDEPETHLHPAMIKKLLWSMQNAMAGQILFTTHSPIFIKPVTLPQVFRIAKEHNSTRAYSMANGRFNPQRLIQELNADNLEMFFADKVLLVEGVSDRIMFRGLIDKFYKGHKDIKVVQTHGKGNAQIYIDLLETFEMPYAIVLDKDALRSHYISDLMRHMKIKSTSKSGDDLINYLKDYSIFILSRGDLEANYPRKYQQHDSKSADALRAASLISQSDFNSKVMSDLKEIILSL